MSRWKRGEATVAKLLTDRHLQHVSGEMSDGQAWLDRAGRTLSSADLVVNSDPESALVLASDAGRQIGTGLLAQLGLRPTTAGGHLAVTRAVIDQFNGRFTGLDALRPAAERTAVPVIPRGSRRSPRSRGCHRDRPRPSGRRLSIVAVHWVLHRAMTGRREHGHSEAVLSRSCPGASIPGCRAGSGRIVPDWLDPSRNGLVT